MKPLHSISDDLPNGGDSREQRLWVYLRDKFPSYEVFWSAHIWPLTNRVYGHVDGLKAIHFRTEVEERNLDLIHMAQAHYWAFASIGDVPRFSMPNLVAVPGS